MRKSSVLVHDAEDLIGRLTDHYDAGDEKELSGEVKLARAVLLRAFLDLSISNVLARNTEAGQGNRGKSFYAETTVRGPARRFCVAMYEPYLEDREFWCDMADFPEHIFRTVCRRKIDEIRTAKTADREARMVEIDRMFTRLLESEDTMDERKFNNKLERLTTLEAALAAE